jgi:putative addiction module component (TIGR02574 family)
LNELHASLTDADASRTLDIPSWSQIDSLLFFPPATHSPRRALSPFQFPPVDYRCFAVSSIFEKGRLEQFRRAVRCCSEAFAMNAVVEHLKDQMVVLSPRERAELAYFLLSSLDSDEVDVEAAWDAEAARRVQEIHSGQAVGRPMDELIDELRERYP